jgi:hypothetical protein
MTVTETRLHIADVSDRVRAAAPDDLREELLRVTAVHEDRDDPPPDVSAVVLAFGEVWKLDGDAEIAAYCTRHEAYLRPLLLFELAHEGSSTEAMRAAATHAGVRTEFAGWERELRAM